MPSAVRSTLSACESFDLCTFCIQIRPEEAPHRTYVNMSPSAAPGPPGRHTAPVAPPRMTLSPFTLNHPFPPSRTSKRQFIPTYVTLTSPGKFTTHDSGPPTHRPGAPPMGHHPVCFGAAELPVSPVLPPPPPLPPMPFPTKYPLPLVWLLRLETAGAGPLRLSPGLPQ